MNRRALVVGTAGHIDHGKTSLVRTLTGVDLDRLPEEKERGITIALGFTSLALPDGRTAAFVDVPGHEKLVRTMIGGATGMDAVVLCVSAVDGAMPQTREHVAVLDLLGVQNGVIALTMADLVDEELLALAADDVRGLVEGTFLAAAPIVPFSAVTRQGVEALVGHIAGFPDTARTASGPFRLPVDRVFVRTGFGVVATGTVISGALADGDQVLVLPEGRTARVRGIEVHGEKVAEATPGHRTALNLSGLDGALERGQVVARGEVPCSSVLDVWYRHLSSSDVLEEGATVRVLHGTTERGARVYVVADEELVEPGRAEWIQLRFDAPLPCWPGDRLVLRRASPAETLGGGVIVDPWAHKVRRRDIASHRLRLQRLQAGDLAAWLDDDAGLSRAEAAARGIASERGVVLGDRVVSHNTAAVLEAAVLEALQTFHRAEPLARGVGRRDLRRNRLLALPERSFDALLERLVERGAAALDGPLIRAGDFVVRLDSAQEQVRAAVLERVGAVGLEGRDVGDLADLGADAIPIAHLLEADGVLVNVAGLGWVAADAVAGLEGKVRSWLAEHGALTPAEFKDLTGLTRRAAIPLLEWLDKRRITRREGDRRIAGPAA